jgi:hypothetical protein
MSAAGRHERLDGTDVAEAGEDGQHEYPGARGLARLAVQHGETSLSGWAVTRVASGKQLRGPLPGDADLARRRLRALGLDPSRALYEQEASR